jgi:hypothetical protein
VSAPTAGEIWSSEASKYPRYVLEVWRGLVRYTKRLKVPEGELVRWSFDPRHREFTSTVEAWAAWAKREEASVCGTFQSE